MKKLKKEEGRNEWQVEELERMQLMPSEYEGEKKIRGDRLKMFQDLYWTDFILAGQGS